MQGIVDEVLAQGVWITRAGRLRGQELGRASGLLVRIQVAPLHVGSMCRGSHNRATYATVLLVNNIYTNLFNYSEGY